jgi:hypothetical protein
MQLFEWLRLKTYPDSLIIFYRKTVKHAYFITHQTNREWYASRFSSRTAGNKFVPANPPPNESQRTLISFIFEKPYIRRSFSYQ